MTPEKDKQLCEKYPGLFENRNNRESRAPIAWGFECGDGWYDLISTLCSCIKNETEYLSTASDVNERLTVRVTQVKEKFGGLRFYIDGGNDRIHGMIVLAESMSYKICEGCGNPGTTRKDGWWRTLCDPCEEKRRQVLPSPQQ